MKNSGNIKTIFFSMNIIYTVKKWKTSRETNYIQRNLDDKRSIKHIK